MNTVQVTLSMYYKIVGADLYGGLESRGYAQMAAYTHYQLRTATDFETEFNTQAHLATYRHNQLSSYMQSALMTQKL